MHADVGNWVDRRSDVDVELDLCRFCRAQKSGVAILQYVEESRVGRIDADRHLPDFNDEAQAFDFCGQFWQGTSRFLMNFAGRVRPQRHGQRT